MGDKPREIELSVTEREAKSYNAANLQSALEGLHQDGLLVLKDVVDVAHIDRIRQVMLEEKATVMQERAGLFNQGVNSNILQSPPVAEKDCLYDDVYFNPYVIQIANAYLGSKPIWNYTTGNNALGDTAGMRQPVHKDITFHHPLTPFYFIANFVLSDFTIANGATEFWLGSHAHTTSADQEICTAETRIKDQQIAGFDPTCNVKQDLVEERRQVRPPVQAQCKKGDIMIRDLRTWHAGMPNETSEDRIMIAIGYQAPWYPNHQQRLFLPLEHADFYLRHGGQPVEVRANFVERKDEKELWKNYNFSFSPSPRTDTASIMAS